MNNDTDRIQWYRKILSEDPASRVFVDLAEMLFSQGYWKDVVDVCRSGLKAHPGTLRAQALLGLALWKLGDSKQAERQLDSVFREIEKNAAVYKVLALISWRKGQWVKAYQLMDIYLNFNPVDAEAVGIRRSWDEQVRSPQEEPAMHYGRDARLGDGRRKKQDAVTVVEKWSKRLQGAKSVGTSFEGIFSDRDRLLLKRLFSASCDRSTKPSN